MTAGAGRGCALGGGQHELGDGVGRAGPAERACRGAHRERGSPGPRGSPRRRAARRRRDASSSTMRAAPASARPAALARWWPPACGYGTTTIGRPERAGLGERRRAGAAHEEVRRGQRRQHLVAQERIRPVAAADAGGQRLAVGERRRRSRLAGRRGGRVTRSTSAGSASETAALKRRTACEPPKTSRTRSVGVELEAPRAPPRDHVARTRGSASRSRSTAAGRRLRRASHVASNDTARPSASRAVARTLRPGMTLPSHRTSGCAAAPRPRGPGWPCSRRS